MPLLVFCQLGYRVAQMELGSLLHQLLSLHHLPHLDCGHDASAKMVL